MALYRTYRPRRFEDVIGQEAVVGALQTALSGDRLNHALLLDGERGTGKTTLARLIAKGLNCRQGPTPQPCGECEACQAIDADRSPDVFELDAASNRGVDEARALRERLAVAPMEGHSLVFILDEAHMLTREAQNTLLKSVEEPPERVHFVFCTTEPGKLLDTVRSRCHRFHLRSPDPEQLTQALQRVAGAEQLDVEDAALAALVREARGSYRDALGLLEQVALLAPEGKIEADQVRRLFGRPPVTRAAELLEHAGRGQHALLLQSLENTEDEADPALLTRSLAELLRAVLYQHALGELPTQLGLEAEAAPAVQALSQLYDSAGALELLEALDGVLRDGSRGLDERMLLEAALLRVAIQPAATPAGAASATGAVRAAAPAAAPAAPESPPGTPQELPRDGWSLQQAEQYYPLVRLALRGLHPQAYVQLRGSVARARDGALMLFGSEADPEALGALGEVMHRHGSWPLTLAPAPSTEPPAENTPAAAEPAKESGDDLDDLLGAAGLQPLD